MKDLETEMIEQLKAGECSVERALLVVSGLDESGIKAYQQKLDRLEDDFEQWRKHSKVFNKSTDFDTAEALFWYLQKGKKILYCDDFELANVIDNWFNREEHIGNCVGLTSLYSVLGVRQELNLETLLSTDHVLTLLCFGSLKFYIENTCRGGFDIRLKNKHRFQKKRLSALVSAAYVNRACIRIRILSDYKGAILDCDKAIKLMPDLAIAYTNRAAVRWGLGDHKDAILDCTKAITLDPSCAEAYINRADARLKLGDYKGYMHDNNIVLRLTQN